MVVNLHTCIIKISILCSIVCWVAHCLLKQYNYKEPTDGWRRSLEEQRKKKQRALLFLLTCCHIAKSQETEELETWSIYYFLKDIVYIRDSICSSHLAALVYVHACTNIHPWMKQICCFLEFMDKDAEKPSLVHQGMMDTELKVSQKHGFLSDFLL